jgi:hypothetical protein
VEYVGTIVEDGGDAAMAEIIGYAQPNIITIQYKGGDKMKQMKDTNDVSDDKLLGQDSRGYDYYLATDNYVYQFKNGKLFGWLCSFPTWERQMHKVLNY